MPTIFPPTVISEGPVSLQAPYWQQLNFQMLTTDIVDAGKIEIEIVPTANDQAIVLNTVTAFLVVSTDPNVQTEIIDQSGTTVMLERWRQSSVFHNGMDILQPLVMPEDQSVMIKLTGDVGDTVSAGTLTVWFATIFRGNIITNPTSAVSAQ